MTAASSFLDQVLSVVGPTLAQFNFVLDDVDPNVDGGGRSGAAVYYRSADSKLQIYKSSREGNINCMIAPADAVNQFGPSDRSLTWRFLNEFSQAPDVSIEELAKSVSYRAKSETEQLTEVRDRIRECYDDARAAILQRNGNS